MLSLDNLPGMLSILGTLLVVHCLLVIIGSFIANKVLVPNDSYLTVAILLQPIFQKMARRGYLLSGKKIEEPSVVYCDTVCGKGSGVRSVTSSEEDESAVLWGFDCDL